jgi:APA family basic amino acid/polyamine antiporter
MSTEGTPAAGAGNLGDLVGGQRVFLRNSTGLVRSASLFDLGIFNICGSLVIPFATGLFWAYAVWPRTNFVVAIILGGIICSFTWVCWALLAATMPRTGGGYIFNTRILSPPIGFAADWLQFISAILAMALWTTWLATVGFAGVFSIWGALRGNDNVAGWATTVSTENWVFLLGLALIFAVFGAAAWSLKKSLWLQNATFLISTGGLVLAVIVMLFTSQSEYISNFNNFAQPYTNEPDSYHSIIAQAREAGFTPHSVGGYSLGDTIGSIFVVLTVSIWAWSSAYLAGEMRGARSASRQLKVMAGAGAIQILLILVATGLFLKAVGSDFFGSINYLNTIGENPLSAPPYYTLLAGVMVGNPIIAALIVFTFIFNIWSGLSQLIGATSRPLFAYSFDGILPQRLAAVNERTHTPIFAIGLLFLACIGVHAWASYATTGFFEIWAYVGLFAFVMMAVTAISAILLPIRRRDDYERSPAKFEIFGIPAVQIAGVASLFTCGVYFALVFKYPSVLGTATLQKAWAAVGIVVASAIVIFYVAKWVRRSEGIRLEAAYAEIPPE